MYDRARFAGVCTSWHAIGSQHPALLGFPLLLPSIRDSERDHQLRAYSLEDGRWRDFGVAAAGALRSAIPRVDGVLPAGAWPKAVCGHVQRRETRRWGAGRRGLAERGRRGPAARCTRLVSAGSDTVEAELGLGCRGKETKSEPVSWQAAYYAI
jgi:hypothetical protein